MGNSRDNFEEYCESVGLSILKSDDKYSSNDTEAAWLLWQYKDTEIREYAYQYSKLFDKYNDYVSKIEGCEKT